MDVWGMKKRRRMVGNGEDIREPGMSLGLERVRKSGKWVEKC
jgi:hypothetical protein